MKKLIASKKWLITYSIILAFLFCLISVGIALIIGGEWVAIGVVILAYMLPVAGVLLFWLNRRACLIWTEDGCLRWKGLLFGFKSGVKGEEIPMLISGGKVIYVCLEEVTHRKRRILEMENTKQCRELLKTVCQQEIYPPELCDKCKSIKCGAFNASEYTDILSRLHELVTTDDYQIISGEYPLDAVKDENGCWADDTIGYILRCKRCGARIICACDTYHGNGVLTIKKDQDSLVREILKNQKENNNEGGYYTSHNG